MLQTVFITLWVIVLIALAFYLGARTATKQIARGLAKDLMAYKKHLEKHKGSETPIGDRLADDWDIKF